MDSAEAALDHLCNAKSNVSCHYLVDETGLITQMVPESERAWHAGQSHWAGDEDINSCSIGIEVVNPGHDIDYHNFSDEQIEAVIALSVDIIGRYGIVAQRVLGHSDVAPRRKKDPGEKFPWKKLFEAGVGHWVEPEPVGNDDGYGLKDVGDDIIRAQQMLSDYGYLIGVNGRYGKETASVVAAFQRHFRPEKVDGRLDRSTLITLERLRATLPASS